MADTPTSEAEGNWLAPEEPDWLSEATSDTPTSDLSNAAASAASAATQPVVARPTETETTDVAEARANSKVRPDSASTSKANRRDQSDERPAQPAQPAQGRVSGNTTKPEKSGKSGKSGEGGATTRPSRSNDRVSVAPTPQGARKKLPRAQRAPRWRGRILPKSILGISLLMLATGIGAATAGTGLYMNYQFRRDESDALVKTFDNRAKDAVRTVQAEGVNARRRIQDEIEPIRKIAATGDTLRDLLAQSQKSVWQVETADINGAAAVGTAFVVASDSDRSFLVTSFNVVRAATAKPRPALIIRKGTESLDAELWTWQESRDLALLIVKKPSLPRLDWGISTDIRLGQQIFAVSGFGTAGGSITQGFIADVSKDGVQHTAALGSHFQGAPLLSDRGLVLGIASRTYEPFGFPSDGVWFAAPIRSSCETVLKCPESETSGAGQVTGAGTQRNDTPSTVPSTADAVATSTNPTATDSAPAETTTTTRRRRRTTTTAP
jgi:S1-C subfamily serine protease